MSGVELTSTSKVAALGDRLASAIAYARSYDLGEFKSFAPGPFSPGLTDVGCESPRTYLPARGSTPAEERRLEAEEVRDAILTASGSLNRKMGGRPVVPPLAAEELYGMSQPVANAWIVTEDKTEHTRAPFT